MNPKIFTPPFRVDTWFERDRSYVILYDANNKEVIEWWDQDVQQAIEDGFLNPKDYLGSAIEYAKSLGILSSAPPQEETRLLYAMQNKVQAGIQDEADAIRFYEELIALFDKYPNYQKRLREIQGQEREHLTTLQYLLKDILDSIHP